MFKYTHSDYRFTIKFSAFENSIQFHQKKKKKDDGSIYIMQFYNSPIQWDANVLSRRLHRGKLPYCTSFDGRCKRELFKGNCPKAYRSSYYFCLEGYNFPLSSSN